MAGLYVGYWKNIKEIEKNNKINKVFEPNIDKKTREKLIKGWDLSIKKTLNWTKDLE